MSVSEIPTDVDLIFDHWKTVHGHQRARLDAKRQKLIRTALKLYPADELCTAIGGYKNSPHHMGKNDRQTVYDDIEVMLRDAKHIDAGLRFAEKVVSAAPITKYDRLKQHREATTIRNAAGNAVDEQGNEIPF